MAPSSRIILVILGMTSVGLALCAALVFGALDRLSLRTTENNVDFLLTQLRDTIEANVGLGLPLSDVRIVQDLIERAKAADNQVLAVEVFSADGVSLFNTDRGSIGEAISAVWQNAVRYRVENDRWRVEEFGNIVVGQVIRNDFAEPVGYLALTVSGEARGAHAETVLVGLAKEMALILPIVLLVVLLASITALELSSRKFRRLAERLAAGAADAPAGTDGAPLAIERAAADFDRATADVLRLDEDEERHAA